MVEGVSAVTWFEGLPDGDTDWDRLARLCPETFEALAGTVAAAWADTDPALLELARLRIAKLLGSDAELQQRSARAVECGLSEQKVAEVEAWPSSLRFTPAERACLALTEQFVMDANGVTDEQVAAVTEHLGGPGCYAFVSAISVLETFQRACLTLGIRTSPGVDEIVRRGGRNPSPTEVS
jgi:alkylhydroperoxidase family enzyme